MCLRCGRYWGRADILAVTEPGDFWQKVPEGMCPVCAGENKKGLVYTMDEVEEARKLHEC